MRIRRGRWFYLLGAIVTCMTLIGCGNFTLSGILDTPVGGGTDEGPGDGSGGGVEALTIVPSTVNVSIGATVQFSVSGGVPPYTFTEDTGGTMASIDSSGLYTAPFTAGSYIVSVTDTEGSTSEATVMVTASTPLSISPVTISLKAGATATFAASGGTPPYSFSVVPDGSVGSVSPAGLYTAPPVVGAPPVDTVRVTDAASNTADASITITEPPALQISPGSISLNTDTEYTFIVSGGVPPYVFSVESGTGTINPATGLFRAPGGVEADNTIRVTDAGLRTAFATVTVTAPGGLLAISPKPATVNAGQNMTFVASGGTGGYTFSVDEGGAGGTINSATGEYQAPLFGGTDTVRVTDSSLDWDLAPVTINPPPPLEINPALIYLLTGNQVSFSTSGGTPPYSYSVVSGGVGGAVDANGVYTAPSTAGSDTVRVTDAGLRTSDAVVTVYFALTIVPTSATVQVNGAYSFSASGGVPGYAYSVIAGAGTIDPSTGLFVAPATQETDTVKVVDSTGNASTATVTVTPAGTWNIVSLDTTSKSGQYASLALDGSGNPWIAYYESQARELRLLKWNGSGWDHLPRVDNSDRTGQYCSLALDSNGNPRISYYDAATGPGGRNLKYAAWDGSNWNLQTIDTQGDVGLYTSLALDPLTGFPRISYFDNTNADLKYAAWNGVSWDIQTVDGAAGGVGTYTSLSLEPGTNRPRISYYDATNMDLKYASWNIISWDIQTVDGASGAVGTYTSLALEPGTNRPRISYFDATNRKLKYAAWNGAGWDLETADSANNTGSYSSLRLDGGTGKPRIAYYDSQGQDLKFAERQ